MIYVFTDLMENSSKKSHLTSYQLRQQHDQLAGQGQELRGHPKRLESSGKLTRKAGGDFRHAS